MSVVGFDFGTVNCKIAVARRRGIDVLQNETGHRMTPAALGFQGKQRFIGGEALAQYMNNAKNTSTNIKRLLGRKSDDVDTKIEEKFITTKLTKTRSNDVGVQVMYEDAPLILSPEQITSAVLFKLKSIAEKGLDGLKVTDCVIGVPANWTDSQRRALLDAARIAGLNVLRLMNESTAIALSYGILRPLPKDTTQKVLFLDMGYAHTQTSLVSFQEGKLKVLAHNVDRNLGGRDFDEMLTQYLVDYIKGKYKMDPTTEFKPMVKLRREAERIKVYLSANSKVPFNLEYFMNDKDVSGIVERPQFDQLAQEKLMPKVIELIKNTLEKANVKKEELQSIEIVGGAVRIPIVQKALQDYFGREMSKTCDGDESVARGCALMCAMISPTFKVKEFEVEDSTPYAIDLLWGPIAAKGAEDKWQPEDSTPLFPVNNSIPSVKLISFNDRSDPFQIVARYAEVGQLPPGTNPVIGRFTISGIPQSGDRKGKIKVKVKLSANSVLSVTSAQLLEEVKEETAAAAAAPAAAAADAAASPAEPKKEDDMDTDKDGDKMETESTAAKDTKKDATKPEEKKIKVKKIDLKVDSVFTAGLDDATINQYFEKENAMQHQDRLIQETHEARNSLEGYILDMRARLTGDLSVFVKDSDRDSFNSLLLDTEDWLNNDGLDVQKSEYKKKLDELHAVGNPIKQRQYEDQNRESYIRAIKSATHNAITFVANKEEKYAHINEEERKKISTEVEKIEQWLLHTQSQQDKLSKADNPLLTCQLLNNKKTEFEKIIHPIITKPKPAPPKEEKKPEPASDKKDEKKAEETKPAADANKPADAKSAENMDTSK